MNYQTNTPGMTVAGGSSPSAPAGLALPAASRFTRQDRRAWRRRRRVRDLRQETLRGL